MALTTRSTRALGAVAAVTLAGAALAACGTEHMVQNAGAAHSAPSAPAVAPPATPSAPSAPSSAPPAKPSTGHGTPPGTARTPAGTGHHGTGHHGSAHHGPAAAGTGRPQVPAHGSDAPHGTAPHDPAVRAPDRATAVTARSIQHGVEAPGRSVALTFDDGPDPMWTPKVLEVLARHHAKATFCEIGPNARAHPDLVRRIAAAGHRLCDHSVHHDEAQSRKSPGYNRHEILDARDEISRAAGSGDAPLWYYRAPGGDFSPAIRAIAADHGLRPLGWTVDSDDWRRPGADAILATVNRELKPGAIVLMHDGGGDRSQTVQALEILLDRLDAAGYTYTFPQR
ncbi:polysaccharide deacetylase family protein [Actinacidiphila glaucinigra]|uniref:polysaccharide deacetylase family protein n=1 Tax=Actinacidiphila glaucinigra TaxID=235986 RepID=UPI0037BD21EC